MRTLLLVLLLSGCALFDSLTDELANGVNEICKQLDRQVVIDAINKKAAPNEIQIHCE